MQAQGILHALMWAAALLAEAVLVLAFDIRLRRRSKS
jgi:hypothetical protein